MSPPVTLLLSALGLLALAIGAGAHGYDWVDGLPDCWQRCLSKTSNGCDSSSCICDASKDNSYLPNAVDCAVKSCKADDVSLSLVFLMPLQGYCAFAGNAVPDSVMSSAYAHATATSQTTLQSTGKVSFASSSPKTTKTGNYGLTAVYTTTITKTSTDGDGNTIQLIVPVVMGPSTMSSGRVVTSTIQGSTSASSSATATPSQSPQASAPASTQAQQSRPVSSTPTASATHRGSNSNGSPFENMQAGAAQWRVSAAAAGVGFVAGIFMLLF